MKDGTIVLQKASGHAKGFEKLVLDAIVFFTESPYVHVLLYMDDEFWESTIFMDGKWLFSGVRTRKNVPHQVALEPIKDLTAEEKKKIKKYMEKMRDYNVPYNFARLVALAVVYPLKGIFKLLNWVPFKAEFFGEVCSTFVDEAYEQAGRDLLPNEMEEYTAPGDFLKLVELGTFKRIK